MTTTDRQKPLYGEPCNGCGECCRKTMCPMGVHLFGSDQQAPCPALTVLEDGASACGAFLDPRKYAPARTARNGVAAMRHAAGVLIQAGAGCDARTPAERTDTPAAMAMIARGLSTPGGAIMRAKRLWGGVNAPAFRRKPGTARGG